MTANAISNHELRVVTDYQQLVDDIESLMASSASVDLEVVGRLNMRYDEAVKSINARLRECDGLLKKGLRNEALERCGTEPNLLDVFSLIDFPERDSWEETVRQCGLTPTELYVSVAKELVEAQATEKPLAELKYQVRLHALARSPLPIRIALLRQIAAQDRNSTVWDEDLTIFEKARHHQLGGEVQSAVKSLHLANLEILFSELQSPDWKTPPTAELSKQVTQALRRIQRQNAYKELQTLEPRLAASFSAFDVARGREVRERWKQCVEVASPKSDDPLVLSATPALEWLAEQDRQDHDRRDYDHAVKSLNQALDKKGTARTVLETRYHALMGLDQGIPDGIRQRLDLQLQRLDDESRRKLYIWIGSGGLAIAIVMAVLFFNIRNSRDRQSVQWHATEIGKIADLEKALEYIDKLHAEEPRIAAASEIQGLKRDLGQRLESDAATIRKFEELFSSAQRQAGGEDSTPATIDEAVRDLSELSSLAAMTSRKNELETRIKTLNETIASRKKEFQERNADKNDLEDNRLVAEFDELKSAPIENLSALQSLIAKARTLELQVDAFGVPRSTKKLTELISQLNLTIAKGSRQKKETQLFQKMNASIGTNMGKFFEQMDLYVKSEEFIEADRHAAFSTVLKSDPVLIAGFEKWNKFLIALMKNDLTQIDAGTSGNLRATAIQLLKDHPGFTYQKQVEDIVAYLGKIPGRPAALRTMGDFLAEKKMFQVLSARVNGNQYYFNSEFPPNDSTGSILVKHYIDTEFIETVKKNVTLKLPEHEVGWKSPQSLFAEEAIEMLKKLQDKNDRKKEDWDQTFIQLIGKLYKSTNMDSILRVSLIYYTIEMSNMGSSVLPGLLEDMKAEIERQRFNTVTVNWVAPGDPEAKEKRAAAERLLKDFRDNLNDIRPLLEQAQKAQDEFRHLNFDCHYKLTGWLHLDENQKWNCSFGEGVPLKPRGGELFVLFRSEAGKVSFVPVGELQQGNPKISEGSAGLVEGRPVFEKQSVLK